MKYVSDAFILAGAAAISYGVSLWSIPGGLIAAGVALLAIGIAVAAGAHK